MQPGEIKPGSVEPVMGIDLAEPTFQKTAEDLRYIENAFSCHTPSVKKRHTERYHAIRTQMGVAATLVLEEVPKSRERSLALTHLEQAMFWANAGIARNE